MLSVHWSVNIILVNSTKWIMRFILIEDFDEMYIVGT